MRRRPERRIHDELVEDVYAGRLHNPSMVSGTLALALAIAQDRLDSLRPADAPWPARANQLARDAELDGLG